MATDVLGWVVCIAREWGCKPFPLGDSDPPPAAVARCGMTRSTQPWVGLYLAALGPSVHGGCIQVYAPPLRMCVMYFTLLLHWVGFGGSHAKTPLGLVPML